MIFISAGHHPAKPGACYEGFCEHDEAIKWVDLIINYLGDEGQIVPAGVLKEKVNFINVREPNLAMEVHFNSFKMWVDYNKDGLVTDDELVAAGDGSETLYYPGSVSGKTVAETVQKSMSQVFRPDRGCHEGWYRRNKVNGPIYFLERTKCPAIIIEPEFIDNKDIITQNRDLGCEQIAKALLEAQGAIT